MSLKDVLLEARRERERRARNETVRKIAVGTVIGSVLGAASGLLFAPKAGKETREDIANYAKNTTEDVRLKAGEAYDTLREKEARLRTDIKDKYETFVDRNMTELDPVKEDLQNLKQDVNSLLKNAKKVAVRKVKDKAEDAKEAAEDVAEEVEESVKEVQDTVEETAQEVKETAEEIVDGNEI